MTDKKKTKYSFSQISFSELGILNFHKRKFRLFIYYFRQKLKIIPHRKHDNPRQDVGFGI